jgi:hypothetical protein
VECINSCKKCISNFKKDLIPLLACYVLEAANFVPLALEDGLRLTNAALEK